MTDCAAPRDAKQAPGGCGPAPVWFPYRAFEGGIVSFPRAAPPAPNAETDRKKDTLRRAEGAKNGPAAACGKTETRSNFRFRQKSHCPERI